MDALLDTEACRFFSPKEMHPLLGRFERLLAQLVRAHQDVRAYVAEPTAVFAAAHQFPIVHLVALWKDEGWHLFRGDRRIYQRRDGHRTVDEAGGSSPGMQPILRLEVVEDPMLTAVFDQDLMVKSQMRGVSFEELDEFKAYSVAHTLAKKPAVLFSAPLAMLLVPSARHFSSQRFTLYQHIFGDGHEYPDDGLFYIGMTARDWKTRWAEHLRAINKGSQLIFHREYRSRIARQRLTYVHHKVMGVAPTLERLQELEEAIVRGHWEDARRLNMIPGGKAGLDYMRAHGMLSTGPLATPEGAEQMLRSWLRENPRKGLPAPWISELWKTDEYALSVICGPEGRLSVDQVRIIRELARRGDRFEAICAEVGALNVQQVRRVVQGLTYGRVV
ncbi:hypothetical protein ACIPRI_25505 [Variovorax sp. LARHSF232]